VTRGKNGTTIYSQDGVIEIPVVPVEEIADPTGVGDAFRGGFLSGYAHQLDQETCGQMGSLAAAYCLEKRGPQGQSYTVEQFISRFRQHFDDRGRLDCLTIQTAQENPLGAEMGIT
jgi:adenosine kinase